MRHTGKLIGLLLMIGCSRELPRGESPSEPAARDASVTQTEHNEAPAEQDAGTATTDASTSVIAHDMDAGAPRAAPDAAAADSGNPLTHAAVNASSAAGAPAAGSGGAGQPAAAGGAPAQPNEQGVKSSDEVFRDDVLRTYELTFTDADWAELQRTATEEIYVPVTLSVDGAPIGKVGVRYKGAYGTLRNCFKDGV